MNTLPKDAAAKAAEFTGLDNGRKKEILDHLTGLTPERQARAIATLQSNGGEEGRFVSHLTGGAAPANKKAVAPQTK